MGCREKYTGVEDVVKPLALRSWVLAIGAFSRQLNRGPASDS